MLQSCSLEQHILSLISEDDPNLPNIYPQNEVIEYGGYEFVLIEGKDNPMYWTLDNYNLTSVIIGECLSGPNLIYYEPVYLFGDLEDSDAMISTRFGTFIKKGFKFPDLMEIKIGAIYNSYDSHEAYLILDEKIVYLEDIIDFSKRLPDYNEPRIVSVKIGAKDYNFSIASLGLYEYENEIYINVFSLGTYKIRDEFQVEIKGNIASEAI